MAQKRSTGHYIWATSLPRLLTGENSCEWVGCLGSPATSESFGIKGCCSGGVFVLCLMVLVVL